MKPHPVMHSTNAYSTKKSGFHSLTTRKRGRMVDANAARPERHPSVHVRYTRELSLRLSKVFRTRRSDMEEAKNIAETIQRGMAHKHQTT